MNWIKRAIRNWLHSDKLEANQTIAGPEPADTNNFNMTILSAMNGKIIQIRTYQPQRVGPDWKTEYYLVPEGERLTDAVTVLLMAKNLEKA
jgi:hypothetical protein